MKATSAMAFEEIKKDGTLGKKQKEVLAYIKIAGPITSRTISKSINGAWKRCSELKQMGCISVAYTDRDPITKKEVTYWKWDSDTPVFNPPTKKRGAIFTDEEVSSLIKSYIDTYERKLSDLYDRAYFQGVTDAMSGNVGIRGME